MAVRRGRRRFAVAAAYAVTLVLSFARLRHDLDSLLASPAAASGGGKAEGGRPKRPAAGRWWHHGRPPAGDVPGCRGGATGAFDGAGESAAVEAACGCVLSGSRARGGPAGSSFWDHPAIQVGAGKGVDFELL